MASNKKSFISRASYIFTATSSESDLNEEGHESLEFDEGEVWNLSNTVVSITEPKKGSRCVAKRGSSSRVSPVSLPINIPDWSKILKEENKKRNDYYYYYNYESDHDEGIRTPPHEYLARRRGASLSVHEGIGRTLKGRDLRSVRNAIWKKVGFED